MYTLSLSLEEIQYILGVLGSQRWADVHALIPKIQTQTQEQAKSQLMPAPTKTAKEGND